MARDQAGERLSSVANAMRMIRAFSDEEYEIGISDLALRLGVAKSTAHRLATTLLEAGMLEQNRQTGKYRLGLALFQLGTLVRRKMDISNEAKPWLMALREQTDETIHLAVPGPSGMLYVNFLESRKAIRMGSRIGQTLPLHCTAEGKVLLAHQTPHAIEQVIAAGLRPLTAHTITGRAAFLAELANIHTQGFALDDEESEPGMRCIAAAVMDDGGEVAAAVGIAGPAQRLSRDILVGYAPDLRQAVRAISARLGAHALRKD
jgi:IclR family KDG regulon transcriptional repressor